MRDAVRDGGVDGVLRDVAPRAEVVCGEDRVEPPKLYLHLMRRLPGARDNLADATHRLRVARHDGKRAEVMQQILRRNRLRADARFGKRDVLRDLRVEV